VNSGPPYAAILFDCDSTLSAIEGIDELARQAGLYSQLAPLTAAAMEGRLTLEAVYRQRLEAIRPTRAAVAALGQCYIQHVVPGAGAVVASLQRLGKRVHIVSGGLRQAVLPLAAHLAIPESRVHAVDVFFDGAGAYQGFDDTSPLSRNGGKTIICRQVMRQEGPAVLVGDGVTDSEVAAAGVDFIGYGGVARRESVQRLAPVYIEDPSLLPVLDYLRTPQESGRKSSYRPS
jgi:phosphoserine phosphatase